MLRRVKCKAPQGTRLRPRKYFFVDLRKVFFTRVADTSRHTHGPALFLRPMSYARAGVPGAHGTGVRIGYGTGADENKAGFSKPVFIDARCSMVYLGTLKASLKASLREPETSLETSLKRS